MVVLLAILVHGVKMSLLCHVMLLGHSLRIIVLVTIEIVAIYNSLVDGFAWTIKASK